MEPFAESEIPLRYTRKNGWVKKKNYHVRNFCFALAIKGVTIKSKLCCSCFYEMKTSRLFSNLAEICKAAPIKLRQDIR